MRVFAAICSREIPFFNLVFLNSSANFVSILLDIKFLS
jgi:hypothetical protein